MAYDLYLVIRYEYNAKKMIRTCLLLLLLVRCAAGTSAQSVVALDDFSALENDGYVYLSWTLRAGSTCNGIQILRSVDSLTFTQVGEIPGVCGSNSSAQRYSFVDSFPAVNRNNYYRLELGGIGISETIIVRVIGYAESAVVVFPNPMPGRAELCSRRTGTVEEKVEVTDSFGRTCWSGSSAESCVEIDLTQLPDGLYYFSVIGRGGQKLSRGKLLKVSR